MINAELSSADALLDHYAQVKARLWGTKYVPRAPVPAMQVLPAPQRDVPPAEPVKGGNIPRNAEEYLQLVCRRYGIKREDLLGHRRFHKFTEPRFEAMWLIRNNVKTFDGKPLSYPAIGRLFGGRDHATVHVSIKKHEERLERERRGFTSKR